MSRALELAKKAWVGRTSCDAWWQDVTPLFEAFYLAAQRDALLRAAEKFEADSTMKLTERYVRAVLIGMANSTSPSEPNSPKVQT